MIEKIKEIVSLVKNEAIFNRRHLHKFPELSFQEYETSRFIKDKLEEYDINYVEVAETGVIARVKGKKRASENIVILRADIDALPIHEENISDFTSQHSGVMHACGHDFHTANLLAVLKALKFSENEYAGEVVAIFQPAEEKIPGGAISVIKSGQLPVNSSYIQGVLGLHVSPQIPVGKVGIRAGKFMASSDELFITIRGRGGHGAQPHQNIDPVVIASQLVLSLQQIVSRIANPATPSVLSIGKFIANGATNVIPDTVYLEGTFRTMDEEWREQALGHIEKQIRTIPTIYGATVDVEIRRGYPVLVNDDHLTEKVKESLCAYLCNDNVLEIPIWMAAEDFAYYTHKYPSVFYLIGVTNPSKDIGAALHTPIFQIDEDAFDQAIGGMIYTVINLLK